MENKGKTHESSFLNAWIARLPTTRVLYPLYLARQLYLDERELTLDSLPPALSGLRIAYASDIHYGGMMTPQRATELAERLNGLNADLMILGGDYGESLKGYEAFWQIMPELHARLGVCAVLGNHDRREVSLKWLTAAMRRRGVRPLVNDTMLIDIEGAKLAVCGPDDCYHGAPNYPRLARQAHGADFVILAPHSPDALPDAFAAAARPFFQLALCGHMHGGQIAPLGINLYTASRRGRRYGKRFRTGVVREKGVTVVVSNGVGTTWIPLRLGARPQYHLFTLRSAKQGENA